MKRLCLVLWVVVTSALAISAPSAASAETAQETANKQVVIGYFSELDRLEKLSHDELMKQLPAALAKYCRPDYVQHNEAMAAFGQGTAGLIRMFERRGASAGAAPGASHVITVMAQGDMVVRVNTRDMPGGTPPQMIFNLFRVKDGLIAEHWDGYSGANPMMPPK